MRGYLVDNNLPRHLKVWAGSNFIYVRDIDPAWTDTNIWVHAHNNDLTVLTKDADFTALAVVSTGSTKLVHFRVGNMRLRDFRALVDRDWHAIEQMLVTHRIVVVFPTRLEATT